MDLEKQLNNTYGLIDPTCTNLHMPTNDVIEVTTANGHYALKLYNSASRTPVEVQWEIDLTLHLSNNNVPVVRPISGKEGYVFSFTFENNTRTGVLFAWVEGEKPEPELTTYTLLGEVAARIHTAADTFETTVSREKYDSNELIDDQIRRIKASLEECGQYRRFSDLCERMRKIITNPRLDYGIIHNDLTLDNVHLTGNLLTVFDLDSSGESWRAAEPWRVLRASEDYFAAWLTGYRSIRDFSEEDEKAVAVFAIVEDIRNVVWKLGYAKSSRGKPLLQTKDLPYVIDQWLEWEQTKIVSI